VYGTNEWKKIMNFEWRKMQINEVSTVVYLCTHTWRKLGVHELIKYSFTYIFGLSWELLVVILCWVKGWKRVGVYSHQERNKVNKAIHTESMKKGSKEWMDWNDAMHTWFHNLFHEGKLVVCHESMSWRMILIQYLVPVNVWYNHWRI